MNEIEKLIQELCPDGVEYRRLLSVSDVLYGYPCDASKFNDNQLGSPLARIRDVLDGYTKTYTTEQVPEKYILRKNDLLIGMDGNFHVANWKMDGGILCQRVCKIYSNDNEQSVLNGYLSHLLKPLIKRIEESKPNGTVKHLLDRDLKELEIPLPPLSIQEKIVEILDKFTSLEVELEAELEARRKQYEYYREKLLTFSPDDENVRWATIKEVASSFTGLTYKPQNVTESGTLVLRSSNIQGSILSFQDNVFVQMMIPERALVKEGDLLVCVRNGSKKLVGKCALITKEAEGMAFGAFMTVLRPKECIISNYLFHIWQSKTVKKQYYGDEGMPIAQITGKDFSRISIPLPPLSEQRRIVEILDRFEALTNDLQAGLPAEIAARRQQYEYYREKLLTFKRKTV